MEQNSSILRLRRSFRETQGRDKPTRKRKRPISRWTRLVARKRSTQVKKNGVPEMTTSDGPLPRISYTPLSEIQKWPRNPKQHSTPTIIESIEPFGFVSPLIVDEKTGRLVTGHARLEPFVKIKAEGNPLTEP